MGSVAGKALVKTPVSDGIVSFLDDWSSVATCGTNDVANMADADITTMNIPLCEDKVSGRTSHRFTNLTETSLGTSQAFSLFTEYQT